MRRQIKIAASVAVSSVLVLLLACGNIGQIPILVSERGPDFLISKCDPGMATNLLRVSLLHPPLTLNPVIATDPVSSLVSNQFTSTLYRYNPIEDTFEPGLATGVDRDQDSKVFTIHLRRFITFSDGTPFTAEDVLMTINYLQNADIKTPIRAYLDFAGGRLAFKQLDAETIQCVSKEELSLIEPILCRIPVLPKSAIEAAAGRNRLQNLYGLDTPAGELVSIGPYVLKSFSREEKKIILERNPNYWVLDAAGQRLPYTNEVVFDFAGTSTDLSMRFRTGESDLIDFLDPQDAERLENVRGLKIVNTGPSCATYVSWFNLNTKSDPDTREGVVPGYRLSWFNELKFRQAVSQLYDRNAILADVFKGKGVAGSGILSPLEKEWVPELASDGFSPANARQLLTEGRFTMNAAVTPNALYGPNKNPVQFAITVLTGDSIGERLAMQIERTLISIGIKATMVSLPYDLFYPKIYSTYDYDMAVMRLETPANAVFHRELSYFSSPGRIWHPDAAVPTAEAEKEMAESLDTFYSSPDWNKRYEAARKVERALSQNKLLVPIVKPDGIFAAKGKIANVNVNHRCATIMWNLEELYQVE